MHNQAVLDGQGPVEVELAFHHLPDVRIEAGVHLGAGQWYLATWGQVDDEETEDRDARQQRQTDQQSSQYELTHVAFRYGVIWGATERGAHQFM